MGDGDFTGSPGLKYTIGETEYKVAPGSTSAYAIYNRSSKILVINGILVSRSVALTVFGFTGPGNVALGESEGSLVYTDSLASGQKQSFCTSPAFTGRAEITQLDSVAMRVSGTFWGNLIQSTPGGGSGTVNISGGSFTEVPLTVN